MLTLTEREEIGRFVYSMLADLYRRKVHDHGSYEYLCVVDIGGQNVDVFSHHPVGRVLDHFCEHLSAEGARSALTAD